MNNDKNIKDEVFEALGHHEARLRAMESVLTALIATHPRLGDVEKYLQPLADGEENLALDEAFGQQVPPEWASFQAQQASLRVQEWLAFVAKRNAKPRND